MKDGIKKRNILFLCHGNLNRSPLAEAVMKKLIEEQGLQDHFSIESAGLADASARLSPAAKKMRIPAGERGYDLSKHRTKKVTTAMVDWADIVLLMSTGNMKRYVDNGFDISKVEYLGLWSTDSKIVIADPGFMNTGSPEIIKVIDIIEESVRSFLKEQVKLGGLNG